MNYRLRLVALFGLLLGSCAPLAVRAQDVTVGEPTWIFRDDAPDELPKPKRKLSVAYPDDMRKSGELGYVILMRFIDAQGKSRALSNFGTQKPFERAAEENLRDWTFAPAKRAGQPADAWVWIPVIFNPKGASAKSPEATPRLLHVTPVVTATSPTPRGVPPVVYMKIKLDSTGAIIAAEPEDKAVSETLKKAIGEALAQWRFAPARVKGQAVAAEITVPVICQPPPKKSVDAITPPKIVKQPNVQYPQALLRSGLRGEVTVEMTIDKTGNVKNPVVVKSNNPGFDDEALKAALTAKYEPSRKNGEPVERKVRSKLVFAITNRIDGGAEAFGVDEASRKQKEALPEELRYDVPAKARGTVFPIYPYELLRTKTGGKAAVSFMVTETGKVVVLKVSEATHPEFGYALSAAMEAFEFDPALKAGRPIQMLLKTEEEFNPGKARDAGEARQLLALEAKSPEKILSSAQLDKPLKPLSQRAPVAPRSIEAQKGEALVEFIIDEEGRVRLPRIVSASQPEFGYAAVQAISAWRFEPPLKNGKAVNTRARVPFNFAPEEKKPAKK